MRDEHEARQCQRRERRAHDLDHRPKPGCELGAARTLARAGQVDQMAGVAIGQPIDHALERPRVQRPAMDEHEIRPLAEPVIRKAFGRRFDATRLACDLAETTCRLKPIAPRLDV